MTSYSNATLQYLKVAARYLEYVPANLDLHVPIFSIEKRARLSSCSLDFFERLRAHLASPMFAFVLHSPFFSAATSGNKVDGINQVRPFRPRDKSQFRIRDVGEIVHARSFSTSSSFSLGKRHR